MLGSVRFLNSDCDPNCRYNFDRTDKVVQIETFKTITPGDELLVKYSKEFFDDEECCCATSKAKKAASDSFTSGKFLKNRPFNSRLDQMLQMRPLFQLQENPGRGILLR